MSLTRGVLVLLMDKMKFISERNKWFMLMWLINVSFLQQLLYYYNACSNLYLIKPEVLLYKPGMLRLTYENP